MPRPLYYTILFFVSLFVMSSLSLSTGLNRKNEMKLDQMIDGTAHKPFVYRQLMPALVGFSTSMMPPDVRDSLISWASRSSTMSRILQRVSVPPDLFLPYVWTLIWMYASLWAFILLLRRLIDALYETTGYFVDAATIAALSGLPSFFSYNFMYDIPTLALFTAGLFLMAGRQWTWFLVIFFLGCWSKETMILLTLIFAIHFYKKAHLEKRLYWKLLLMQLSLFIAVKTALAVIFFNNPGGVVEFHLLDNLLFGYQFTTAAFLAWLFGLLLICYRWKEKPLFLKNALWIGVPLIILTLFLGLIHETRDYGEIYPILAALMIHSAAVVVQVPITSKEDI